MEASARGVPNSTQSRCGLTYTLIPAGRKLDVPHCRQQSDMLQLPEYTLTFNDKDFLLEGTSRKLSE